DPPARASGGQDAAGDVDLGHDPAAEDVAGGIGVGGRGRNPQRRLFVLGQLYRHCFSTAIAQSTEEPDLSKRDRDPRVLRALGGAESFLVRGEPVAWLEEMLVQPRLRRARLRVPVVAP